MIVHSKVNSASSLLLVLYITNSTVHSVSRIALDADKQTVQYYSTAAVHVSTTRPRKYLLALEICAASIERKLNFYHVVNQKYAHMSRRFEPHIVATNDAGYLYTLGWSGSVIIAFRIYQMFHEQ